MNIHSVKKRDLKGKPMKRIIFILALISICFYAFADDEAEMYSYLYNSITTVTGRLGIVKAAANSELDGGGDFYAQALDYLIMNMSNLSTPLDREAADETAMILVNLLGREKYASAAGNVWKVVDSFQNPVVRAEAMMALGSMQATAFLPQLLAILNSQNMSPTQDPDVGEKLAYGAIISLEKYKDPRGYLPVFFASIGWYSDRIKDTAAKALPLISEDPTEPLLSLIRSSGYGYEAKYNALRAIDTSNADVASKTRLAVAAYQQGWQASTSVTRDRMILNNLRKYAMGMIKEHRPDDAAVYPLLERSYKEGTDW